MTDQLALFTDPPQKRRTQLAGDLYAKILELRRAGSDVRAEGFDIAIDGRRMGLRDFRRLYDVGTE